MTLIKMILPVWMLCLVSITLDCKSQPFLDLINLQYLNSPDGGLINQEKNAATLQVVSVQTTIPIQLRNKKDVIILSPFFDQWQPCIKVANKDFFRQFSVGLPVSVLKSFGDSDWSLLTTVILRRNGHELSAHSNWQLGGAMIANFKANETLTYKAGIYVNREFFGAFVMPLLGIDWQINKKTNLFGLLPGNLTLERKLGNKTYIGGSFKAITSSFKTNTGFWRLDENRLGIFFDFYVVKRIVVSAEAGHSILRKMRTGIDKKVYTDWGVKDNAYVKASLAYRLRFR